MIAANSFPRVEVKPHHGAPSLFLEGAPVFPLLLMTSPRAIAELNQMHATNIHLFTDVFPLGWTGIERYDFSAFDAHFENFLKADSQAMILPRLHLDAPEEWMEAHPDEMIQFADAAAWYGETCWGGPRHASFASKLWREDASEALRRLIRHVAASGYAERVLGWHLGAGTYGEWHHPNAVYYPDTSSCFVKAFSNWLRARYPDEKVEPRLPTIAERRAGEIGMFRDPAKAKWLLDHAEFFHLLGADALSQFAAVAAQESAGRSLVLAFNGYLPDMGVNHEVEHRAFERVLRDENIAAFASPHSYAHRKPGEAALLRGFPASTRALGKLWFDEADERTHLAHPTPWKHAETHEEAIGVLWRAFAHALTQSCGLWFMDQGALWFDEIAGSWYREQEILQAFSQMQRIGQSSLQHPRPRAAEVAVVSNFKAAFHLADRASGEDNVSGVLFSEQLQQLAHCGAPFDFYLLSELFEPSVPEYKTYIFLDAFLLSDNELEAVRALRDKGKTLLFFYAAGFVSDTEFSLKRMQDLLQMPVELTDAIMLANGSTQSPGFVAPPSFDTEIEGLASSGNVWFCAAPPLSADGLRAVLASAGVHSYLESDDTVMVGGGYLAVHAACDGTKTLQLPARADWANVRDEKMIARNAELLKVEMKRGETQIFSVVSLAPEEK